jgi:hypothetical protein
LEPSVALCGGFVASLHDPLKVKAYAFVISLPGVKDIDCHDRQDFEWLTEEMMTRKVAYDPIGL